VLSVEIKSRVQCYSRGGVAQWVARQTRNVELVGSRNGFERDFTIKLK